MLAPSCRKLPLRDIPAKAQNVWVKFAPHLETCFARAVLDTLVAEFSLHPRLVLRLLLWCAASFSSKAFSGNSFGYPFERLTGKTKRCHGQTHFGAFFLDVPLDIELLPMVCSPTARRVHDPRDRHHFEAHLRKRYVRARHRGFC